MKLKTQNSKDKTESKNSKLEMKEILNQLLINRGIVSQKDQDEFFSPRNPQEITPNELGIDEVEVKKAIDRIKEAIDKKEKIIVYGDYDVDGICATAIMWETLDSLGANALPYIPSRFTEGYGLNKDSIEKLKKDDHKDAKLLITVDQGIVAHEQIAFANSLGLDVILTDHHDPKGEKPDALAIIHTQRISGSAVSWILARELLRSLKGDVKDTNLSDDHLGLAALGTVADVLPLIGYNRSIAVWGLRQLRNSQRLGLKFLCEESAVKQEEMDTYHIGFMLAPRINAAGRVEHAMDSLRLICSRTPEKARELAKKLGDTNRLRQDKTEFVVSHVKEKNGESWDSGNLPKLLFVHNESYEEGVIGIAAGRLVDQYHRPAIVLSKGDEFSKASVRSIPGVNIIELLRKAGDEFFKGLGGHPMAAGFSVPTEKLEALSLRLQQLAEELIDETLLVKQTRIDMEISFEDISLELVLEIQKMGPFGFGNLEPVFKSQKVFVNDAKTVGKDNSHLKIKTYQGNIFLEGIAFRMGELMGQFTPKDPIEIVYSLEINEWQGRRSLQLKVKNILF
jgi:single-stranded-DNA-specific exonuclease